MLQPAEPAAMQGASTPVPMPALLARGAQCQVRTLREAAYCRVANLS